MSQRDTDQKVKVQNARRAASHRRQVLTNLQKARFAFLDGQITQRELENQVEQAHLGIQYQQ